MNSNSSVRFLRFPLALTIASLITLLLFELLRDLTQVHFTPPLTKSIPIEFTRVTKESPPVITPTREKPELVLPPALDRSGIKIKATEATVLEREPFIPLVPTTQTPGTMTPIANSGSDHDILPLVRINPDYPMRAQERAIEGWVKVRFNISVTGNVMNAEVIESSPKGVFDDAVIKAITRWRYNPQIVDAIAVERHGVETVLRFNLPDQ